MGNSGIGSNPKPLVPEGIVPLKEGITPAKAAATGIFTGNDQVEVFFTKDNVNYVAAFNPKDDVNMGNVKNGLPKGATYVSIFDDGDKNAHTVSGSIVTAMSNKIEKILAPDADGDALLKTWDPVPTEYSPESKGQLKGQIVRNGQKVDWQASGFVNFRDQGTHGTQFFQEKPAEQIKKMSQ